ncbi:MAG TPA: phosphoribosylamine--glycine ligase [Deltaproteobacteria bacterium]|nr:phosphoribosylamine--glycine ligase [Deltaproteobacteria bacterium]HCP48128.1 phosphoribosylamine--glycine ligase [Deltaproteobacteria bacterium]
MRVLVIGSGGREHALCWKIARSPLCEELYCAPGNAGIAQEAELLALTPGDSSAVLAACRELSVDLVVVGPEQPLVDGLADVLRTEGIAVFGPTAAGARLEGSKSFAKDFMVRHGIPTAAAHVFDDGDALMEHLESCRLPTVVKADGLAAGKGVLVCTTREQALDAGRLMAQERRFGEASDRVVVEEFLMGEEATVLALVDGDTVVPLQASQDHKRRFDGDMGPNTGGMGAYTPVPAVSSALMERVCREVLQPAASGLVAEGMPYQGLLYAGLMLCADGPRVIEFNCRFGDPEAQPLLMALDSDLLPLLDATARGQLASAEPPRWYEGAVLCVVLVSGGYPGAYPKGLPISGLGLQQPDEDVVVFHAGTLDDGSGEVLTAGGRVLGVTARGTSLDVARDRAYAQVSSIDWDGMDYRTDIAVRALRSNQRDR